jgi:hypothetical protein
MSDSAFKHSKEGRRLCQRCQDRKAKFQYRGQVRADRDHTLCFECFRSQRDRNRARAITSPQFRLPLEAPRQLTERQVAHRRQMLAALASGC